jgi:general secretion pathway protein D
LSFPFPTNFLKAHSGTQGSIALDAASTGTTTSSGNPYQMQLDFLRTQTDTKTLARPKILTLNNETAEIEIITKKSLNNATTTNTEVSTSTSGVERQPIGVTLRVTPQVNPETGEITLVIISKDSNVISTALTSSTSTGVSSTTTTQTVFDPDERSTKCIVRVKDGDTIVIAGLIRNDFSETITKLPFLGDLPLLGTFFRHRNRDQDTQRELMIFITPHIVRDSKIGLAQAKSIIIPEREQSTAIGTDRRKIIEASLNNFNRKK